MCKIIIVIIVVVVTVWLCSKTETQLGKLKIDFTFSTSHHISYHKSIRECVLTRLNHAKSFRTTLWDWKCKNYEYWIYIDIYASGHLTFLCIVYCSVACCTMSLSCILCINCNFCLSINVLHFVETIVPWYTSYFVNSIHLFVEWVSAVQCSTLRNHHCFADDTTK